jgi:hypothetical protein
MRAIRTSKRLLRRWIALWLEDRRRARAATHVGPTVPNAPANLIGTDLVTYIQLDWQDMSGNELGFRLYRKVDAGGYGLFQTFGPNVVSYQDNAVVISHWYYYYVTAYNAVGESAHSNEVSVQAGSS